MKYIEQTIRVAEHESALELSKEDRELLVAARMASRKAHAPFSNFEVGAAVIMDDHMIYTGNNQESVAFPSGLCAERVLLFRVLSEFPDKKIRTLAITCSSGKQPIQTPQTPCGSCRQIISEAEQRQGASFRLLLQGETGPVWVFESASLLMPWPFNLEQ